MKQPIDPFDYAPQILHAEKTGILMTTQVGDKINPMTIGWGTIGIQWGKPIFIAFVRDSRYTHQLLDQSHCFTVNVALEDVDKEALRICGTQSGRDIDKIKEAHLTPVPGEHISAPGLKEFPLTLEFKVIYQQYQDKDALTAGPRSCYPTDDYHHAYYGEIVSAYILE